MTVMNNLLFTLFGMETKIQIIVFNQGIMEIPGILDKMEPNRVSVKNVIHVMGQDIMHKNATL